MNQLVSLTPGGVAVTSSLAIALGTANDHASVIRLVRTYQADLEEFGLVGFQIQPRPAGQHGGGDVEFAYLNEPQAALLMTYMRNSDIVRAFKKALVKAFFELARRLTPAWDIPKTYAGALALAARQAEELDQKTEAIAVLEPKAAFCDAVSRTGDTHSIIEAAKILGTGQNRLFDRLREWGFLFRDGSGHLPYQQHVDSGLFKVVEEHYEDARGRDRVYAKVLITGRGLVAIQRKFAAACPVALVRPQHQGRA